MNFFEGSKLSLPKLRNALIRMEDTIVFDLIERAQYPTQPPIYENGGVPIPEYDGPFVKYFLNQIETVHARVRRYTSPDENAFTPKDKLPAPILPALDYPTSAVKGADFNVNDEIFDVYTTKVIPSMCSAGVVSGNFGSAATCDVECLQSLSKRIHYGKFIAEAKFCDPVQHEKYVALIKARDSVGIEELLTNAEVEAKLLARVRRKALVYGQDIVSASSPLAVSGEADDVVDAHLKINPDLVAEVYKKWIIPLTKKVEVQYLLQRLDVARGRKDSFFDSVQDNDSQVL